MTTKKPRKISHRVRPSTAHAGLLGCYAQSVVLKKVVGNLRCVLEA